LVAAGPGEIRRRIARQRARQQNVTITTPIRLGIANISRFVIMPSMATSRTAQPFTSAR
jgi:hypothetical protein